MNRKLQFIEIENYCQSSRIMRILDNPNRNFAFEIIENGALGNFEIGPSDEDVLRELLNRRHDARQKEQ